MPVWLVQELECRTNWGQGRYMIPVVCIGPVDVCLNELSRE